MQLDNLKEYFEHYVLKYAPYKDSATYTRLSSFLLNYYLTHSYQNIPQVFKSLYEDQQIPVDLYDTLLLSNGFPNELISKLKLSDKYTLLYSFMDYNKYKGSIELMRKISNSFNESFNLYELFIDWRDDVGWVFVPYQIYKNNNYQIEDYYLFEPIANATRKFFITKEYLDELKANSDIIFPIKTNLIFTDYKNIEEYNEINKLIFLTVFRYFKDYRLILSFDRGDYQISFENIYKLWYYIFFKAFPLDFEYVINNSNILPLVYSIENNLYYYPEGDLTNSQLFTIDNIEKMVSDYNSIYATKRVTTTFGNNNTFSRSVKRGRFDLTKFYKTYFFKLRQIQSSDVKTNLYLINKYIKSLPKDLRLYVDAKLDSDLPRDTVLYNVTQLLLAIKSSLITWSYSFESSKIALYNKYLLTFISQLPIIRTKFSTTTSYYMIDFMKPYHVELVEQNDYLLKVKTKFDSVYIDDWYYSFIQNFLEVSVLVISEDIKFQSSEVEMDFQPIVNSIVNIVDLIKKEKDIYNDEYMLSLIKYQATLTLVSEYIKFQNQFKTSNHQSITNSMVYNVGLFSNNTINNIQDEYFSDSVTEMASFQILSHKIESKLDNFIKTENVFAVDKFNLTYIPP